METRLNQNSLSLLVPRCLLRAGGIRQHPLSGTLTRQTKPPHINKVPTQPERPAYLLPGATYWYNDSRGQQVCLSHAYSTHANSTAEASKQHDGTTSSRCRFQPVRLRLQATLLLYHLRALLGCAIIPRLGKPGGNSTLGGKGGSVMGRGGALASCLAGESDRWGAVKGCAASQSRSEQCHP